jgi:transcriptional regulator with XRE-family HTH domain
MDKLSGNNYLIAFGKHVAKLREQTGLSLRELAQLCDLDHSNIAKIEKGQKNCQLLTLVELAAGLGVEVKDLVEF